MNEDDGSLCDPGPKHQRVIGYPMLHLLGRISFLSGNIPTSCQVQSPRAEPQRNAYVMCERSRTPDDLGSLLSKSFASCRRSCQCQNHVNQRSSMWQNSNWLGVRKLCTFLKYDWLLSVAKKERCPCAEVQLMVQCNLKKTEYIYINHPIHTNFTPDPLIKPDPIPSNSIQSIKFFTQSLNLVFSYSTLNNQIILPCNSSSCGWRNQGHISANYSSGKSLFATSGRVRKWLIFLDLGAHASPKLHAPWWQDSIFFLGLIQDSGSFPMCRSIH